MSENNSKEDEGVEDSKLNAKEQSKKRAEELMKKLKGNIDNSNKKAVQRMMVGLKKILDLHNPIELSSICGSLFLKVQERGHISLKSILKYAEVNGAPNTERIEKIISACWEEPLMEYIRSELNPNFHRAKDPAVTVINWWKEGGIIGDERFTPHFMNREVKKKYDPKSVVSEDITKRLWDVRIIQEGLKISERQMFSVQNYDSICDYLASLRTLRKAEIEMRNFLITEVETARVRLDTLDEVLLWSLKHEEECNRLRDASCRHISEQIARAEIRLEHLIEQRNEFQKDVMHFNEYIVNMLGDFENYINKGFPSICPSVEWDGDIKTQGMRSLRSIFMTYKEQRDFTAIQLTSRKQDNEKEISRLQDRTIELEGILKHMKEREKWEERRMDAEELGLQRGMRLLVETQVQTEVERDETWERTLRVAANAHHNESMRYYLRSIITSGIAGNHSEIKDLSWSLNELLEVLDTEQIDNIYRNKEMEEEEKFKREFDYQFARAERTRKKKAAAKKKGKGKGSKGGDDAASTKSGKSNKSGKSGKSSKASAKSGKSSKGDSKKGGKKKGGGKGEKKKEKGGDDDAKSTKSGKSGKSDGKKGGAKKKGKK